MQCGIPIEWQGAFSIYKKIWKIAIWEDRVPFVTSSIRGSRARPGRLKDRERYGTGDKDEKKWNTNFHRENGTTFFQKSSSVYFRKFLVERTKLHPNRNFRNFLVNGEPSRTVWHLRFASNRIPVLAQRTLGSSGGKHCKSLEGNVWRKVVSTSSKTILGRNQRFFAVVL